MPARHGTRCLALGLALAFLLPVQALAQEPALQTPPGQEATEPLPTEAGGDGPLPSPSPEGETPPAPPAGEETPAPQPQDTPLPSPSAPASPLPSASPEASPSPAPGQSPTPAPTPTPAATPTPLPSPTPSPSPSPTPHVSLVGEDLRLTLGQSFDPGEGVSATDEAGNALSVTLVDDGGFNPHVVGVYRLTYQAIHPVTGQAYTLVRNVEVYKSAAQAGYTVTILAGELVLKAGGEYDLLKDVKAQDETGATVEYGVYDRGNFRISQPGTYKVVIGALHPVTGELFTQERTVRVLSEEEYAAWERAQRRLSGDSNERYARYLQYRNEIYEKLKVEMDGLTAQLSARIDMLASVFADKELELVQYTPAIVDGLEDVPMEAGLRHYPTGAAAYTPLSSLTVSNWSDILAVFVAASSLDVAEPLDLMNLRKIQYDGLGEVFWDMNQLTYHVEGDTLRVMITPSTAQEMPSRYGWDPEREMVLEELMQPEFLKVFASLTGDTSFDDMSEAEMEAIRATLPQGLDVQRESVVMTASSLVGKVSYFWGGKYNELGWNPLWGIPRRVTSEGSVTSGKIRNYGLDCSGFVAWAFINATGDPSILSAIGNGSANQWANSTSLGWDEAQPGDLAFRAKPGSVDINHVGIVASVTEDGQYMIVHCSSKENGVVVTEAWSSGFRYFRRPALYGEEAAQ